MVISSNLLVDFDPTDVFVVDFLNKKLPQRIFCFSKIKCSLFNFSKTNDPISKIFTEVTEGYKDVSKYVSPDPSCH